MLALCLCFRERVKVAFSRHTFGPLGLKVWEKSLAMVMEAKTSRMWGDFEDCFSPSYDFSHFFHVCRD